MADVIDRGPSDRVERVAAEPIPRFAGLRRISWGAIFAGVVVALVTQLVLSMLGLGIGASQIEPLSAEGTPRVSDIGAGAGIWFAVTGLLSLFVGGWVAGRLAGIPRHVDGMLHGILAWGLTTLVTMYLLTTAVGAVLSGAASVVGSGLSLLGQGVGAAAPAVAGVVGSELSKRGVDLTAIVNEAKRTLEQTGKPELQPRNIEKRAGQLAQEGKQAAATSARNPQEAGDELTAVLTRILTSGKDVLDAVDREALENVLVARSGMSRQEAKATVTRWEATYRDLRARANEMLAQAEQGAREAADAAARAVSQAAIWSFVAFLLAGIAAAIGGFISSPREVSTAELRPV